jgi:adenosylmethionine-8-amino-7-oxononanoate aminotransferase
MSTTTSDAAALRELATRHLWLHFTAQGPGGASASPMIVRGDGCYVYDSEDRRFLDGLSSLFCVNVGHGRADIAEAGSRQAAELGYFSNWAFSHPRAAELAARIAGLAPADLNRVFFTGGGGESIEAAIKLSRQYHKLSGSPMKTKVIAREGAYHGTSFGALSLTGITSMRQPFEPLLPGVSHVPAANAYRARPGSDPLDAAEAIRERILFEGPDTVAAIVLEPVQNSGGCIPPPPGYFQRVREICDAYDVLLVSDDVICSWGRLGTFFGAERYDYRPDLITTAKGLTSAYAPMGAVIASDRVFDAFAAGGDPFLHGVTFGGHPGSAAVALANIDVLEHEGVVANVQDQESTFRAMLESLYDIPIVGDVRGAGFFQAIELVGDVASKQLFAPADRARISKELSADLLGRGLICRVVDRGGLWLQLAPPLIAGPEQFTEIEAALRPALTIVAEKTGAHA